MDSKDKWMGMGKEFRNGQERTVIYSAETSSMKTQIS